MSKQTVELRGRRARAERRRVEKALKRRIEGDAAVVDDAPDCVGVDGVLDGSAVDEGLDGSGEDQAPTEVDWSGLVAGVQRGGACTVLVDGRTYGASVTRDLAREGYTLTVGDRVRAVLDTPGRVTIVGVEPRRTKLA